MISPKNIKLLWAHFPAGIQVLIANPPGNFTPCITVPIKQGKSTSHEWYFLLVSDEELLVDHLIGSIFSHCIICILVPKKQQFAQKKATAVNVLSQPNQSMAQVPRVTILLTIKQNVQRQQNIFLAKQKDLFPDLKARGVPLCCCLFEISCHISDFCICWKRITILWFLHTLNKTFFAQTPRNHPVREKKKRLTLGEEEVRISDGSGICSCQLWHRRENKDDGPSCLDVPLEGRIKG